MRRLAWLLGAVGCAAQVPDEPAVSDSAAPVDPTAWIEAAGTTADDAERLAILEELRDTLPADDPLQADLDLLLPTVERWADPTAWWEPGDQDRGEAGYLCGWFTLTVWPGETSPVVPAEVSDGPLHPIWALYRGRLLVWNTLEHGVLRDESYAEADAAFAEALAAFPDNPIAQMYGGRSQPWPTQLSAPAAGLPDWATAQRTQLSRLAEVIDWWVVHRQMPDGQLGGGWGDDVELWRKWAPVLIGFDDPGATAAWTLLSEGMWALPRMAGGYSTEGGDVEHSAEDTADTLTPMLLMHSDDPAWGQRADRLATLLDERWLAENDRGWRQLPSVVVGPEGTGETEAFACDTVTHVRAVQPALLRWQRGELDGAALAEWLVTWVELAGRASEGKPAGVVPSAMAWPTGEAARGDWWDPGCYASDAYAYPKRLGLMLRALVVAGARGDASADTVVTALGQALVDGVDRSPEAEVEGTLAWAVAQGASDILDALAARRALTGATDFDALLADRGDAVAAARAGGDRAALDAAIVAEAEGWEADWPALTSEVLFTDRAFKAHSGFLRDRSGAPVPRTGLLYEAVTGDVGAPAVAASPAVRWRTPPTDFAALVTARGPRELAAEVVSFSAGRDLAVELRALDDGDHAWSLDCGGARTGGVVAVAGADRSLALSLPADTLCLLEVGGR